MYTKESVSSKKIPIAIAEGDGIGPEIMKAACHVLDEAKAPLLYHPIEIGEKCYLAGHKTGISPAAWDTLKNTRAFLKAPITTPQGGGYKSLNVTIRTTLGLYANIRPCVSYAPFIETKHPKMHLIIVRENEEDLYAGIEYQQTPDVCTSIKIISRPGTEKIVRFAFAYAKANHRKKVTCFTKDNILKLSDGLFHKVYEEIGKEYPEIEKEHWIVDIGAAKLADTPEIFDILVLPNLYGDILSDVAAQISGSVGLGASANIGDHGAMFEAIHGSAPKRAGQNTANPSGLLLSAVLMLQYLNQKETAETIHNAWLKTIEEGLHTYDIYQEGKSKKKLGTLEFAKAVVNFLGQKPKKLQPASHNPFIQLQPTKHQTLKEEKRICVGVDAFLYSNLSPLSLQEKLSKLLTPLKLKMLSNRGTIIWPEGHPETFCVDQFRARYGQEPKGRVDPSLILDTLQILTHSGLEIIKTENLYKFDNHPTFSTPEIY